MYSFWIYRQQLWNASYKHLSIFSFSVIHFQYPKGKQLKFVTLFHLDDFFKSKPMIEYLHILNVGKPQEKIISQFFQKTNQTYYPELLLFPKYAQDSEFGSFFGRNWDH